MPCSTCGATLPAEATKCAYCGTETPFAAVKAERDEARRAAAEAEKVQAKAASAKAVADAGKKALHWALAGLVLGCFFIPQVVSVVLAFRARRLAAQHGEPAPVRSTIALAMAGVQVLGAIALWIMFSRDSAALDKHRAEVRARVERSSAAERIDQGTACGVVELWLLEKGYEGTSPIGISAFECSGKLTLNGDRATLEDVRFRGSQKNKTVNACLKRGTRWLVGDIRAEGVSCDEAVAASASATAGPAPSATEEKSKPSKRHRRGR